MVRQCISVVAVALVSACSGSVSNTGGSSGAASGGAASGGAASGGAASGGLNAGIAGSPGAAGAASDAGDAGEPGMGGTSGGVAGGPAQGDNGGEWSGVLAPWPSTCVAANERPAGISQLTGPAGSYPPGPVVATGETMSAVMNGVALTFDKFSSDSHDAIGYSINGRATLVMPSFAVGTYSCPQVQILYSNASVGANEYNEYYADACCTIQITKSGPPGSFVEGTFSGILNHNGTFHWINLSQGNFKTILRGAAAGGSGGQGGTGSAAGAGGQGGAAPAAGAGGQ